MNKPTPNITHKAGKRSTVYYDDYKRLLEYCELLEADKLDMQVTIDDCHFMLDGYQNPD